MKSCIVFFISIFLLLQIVGCRKETVEPVVPTNEIVEPVTDTTNIDEPVADTTNIVPWPPSPGEVIVENLNWLFPWYSTLEIPYFGQRLPSVAVFKVYIKRWNSVEWIEVPLISNNSSMTIKYEYFVEKRPDGAGMYNFGSLYIFYYGLDADDNPSVKIEY